ncbi:hypothetical protein CYMTET_12132 [Cymbomonas tetramitiformis]|uniref:Uncharacterized protein n=1 Tax=Cymbomonas tetramitiformis TaxID=36881 RepID=A0AAE0GMB4_9CHLO|nr:hypothetical protein CYMTET_12132 [Cymbomonas tetramitiformis]
MVSVCMDATKLSSQLQFDRRRGAVVGGTVDQGIAKLVVSDGTEYHQFLEQTTQIVEADQVNVLSMSRHRPGSCAMEIALCPHRHCRSDLRKEQQGAPLQAYNGVSEFWRANKVLNAISTHHTIVSFGADAGTEGTPPPTTTRHWLRDTQGGGESGGCCGRNSSLSEFSSMSAKAMDSRLVSGAQAPPDTTKP